MKIAGWVNGISYLSQASIGTIAIILASVRDEFPHLGTGASWNDERASYEIQIPEARISWINADGAFEFPGVDRGKYVAMAIGGATPLPPKSEEWMLAGPGYSFRPSSKTPITVGRDDVVSLEIPQLWVLFGRVIVEGGGPLPIAPRQVEVFSFTGPASAAAALHVELRGERPSTSSWAFPISRSPISVRPRADGLFSFDLFGSGSRPDPFIREAKVHLVGLPEGYRVKSISYGELDLLQESITVDGLPTAEIVVTLSASG